MTPRRDPFPARPDEAARRRKSRALITALLLGAFVILVYFISMAKYL